MPGENHRNQGIVQIDDGWQGIERAFGEGSFRTCAGGGWRFTRHAADVFHEQLRQIHVMDGIVDRQRANARVLVGRVVSPAWDDGPDHAMQGLVHGEFAMQSGSDFLEVDSLWLNEVGTNLQVARILGGNAIHHAGMGAAHEEAGPVG